MQKPRYLQKAIASFQQRRRKSREQRLDAVVLPKEVEILLFDSDLTRDFREFLQIIGLPDLIAYVNFVLSVLSLQNEQKENSEKNAEINKEEVVEIYTRYLKPYAQERLDIDWMARTKVERRLKSGLVIPEIFNESLQLACSRFVAKLSKFLQSIGVLLN
ncbi:unnamed protein product [Oikopleura dioica]|uniref:Uncharacterized protein n=1 Tax=Oikopleura dioica TaxID=34765 RepID=E4Z1E1_OIKDI|nr:unnamed protein product [Oikopleura dioica]